jgi:hypothetical protein
MRPQGKAFDGACSMWGAYRDLEAIAGLVWWIDEYQPIDYAERYLVEYVLYVLCGHDLCCGTFVRYTTGIIRGSRPVSLFVADCENVHLLNLFQARPTPIFIIGLFTFTLVQRIDIEYLEFSYLVTLCDRSLTVHIIPVDSTAREIGPFSSLDFAHFLWNYTEDYNFCWRAIIAFPIHGRVRIFYVQHHMARSDGWLTTELCDNCAQDVRLTIHETFGCSLHRACSCAVCVKQPPTLKATAAHVVFTWSSTSRDFGSQATSFDHFFYAYASGRVAFAQLVPNPDGCVLRKHRYHPVDERRYHTRCVPPMRALPMPASRTQFSTRVDALHSFIFERRRWWCSACDRPLFECAPCHNRNRPSCVTVDIYIYYNISARLA